MRRQPAWPSAVVSDPWDDDPGEGEPCSPAVLSLIEALRRGEVAAARAQAEALGLVAERPRLSEIEGPTAWAPTLEALVRVACDWHPAVGNEAPDLLLGPWADELDPVRDRRLLAVALASAGLERAAGARRSAVDQWARQDPAPPQEERDAVRALARAPWSLRVPTDAGWVDRLGVSPWGPARLVGPAGLPGATAAAAALVRVIGGPDGPVAPLGIVLPVLPPPAVVARAVAETTWRSRLEEPRRDVAEALAATGHLLVRRVLEWLWAR